VPGARAFDDVAALCAAGAGVVHVLTPPAAHAAVALEAIEHGCDVLVEKPLATDVADCDRMAAAARRRGVRVGVGHSLLHDPWIGRLLAAVDAGRIGRVVSAEYVCTAEYPPWGDTVVPPHYRDGGYPFRDLGVHGLYLLRALLGEIEGLHVERRSLGGDPNLAFDEWHALVHATGGTGRIRLSWNARPLETYLVVHGERGMLRADVGRCFLGRRLARALPAPIARTVNTLEDAMAALVAVPRSALALATGRLRPYAGLRGAVVAFHRALAEGAPLPASLDDGRAVVRWVEEAARPADLAKTHRAWRLAPRARGVTVVTGAAGFVGSRLVQRLVEDGETVRAVVRREPVPPALRHERVEVVLADLGDARAVSRALEQAVAVYHVGATMRGGAEEHDRGTIAGTRHVVEACRDRSVSRLVHVSSLSVLHLAGLADGACVTEDAPLEPMPEARGHYTRAKLAAEQLVLDAAAQGLDAVIVRPGLVVGPGQWTAGTVDGVRVGRLVVALGAGDVALPLVHVDDVVDALVRAGRTAVPRGAIYHVVDDARVTRATLARAIAAGDGARAICVPTAGMRALGLACEALARGLRRPAPLSRYRVQSTAARVTFDCSRAARELGWRPRAATVMPPSVTGRASASAATAPVRAPDRATASPGRAGAPAAAAR
jgi:nucleoside-diphosphate-sugar epimerase/predicted dehydrogenase